MSFRLALACCVAALAAPAAHASPPIPSVEDVLSVLDPGGAVVVEDYCVYEEDRYGNRRLIACAPAGRLPALVLERPI